jgi:raffinose/stachyose/melibiose transport system permease protein
VRDEMKSRRRPGASGIVTNLFLLVMSLLFLVPFYITFVNAFKLKKDIIAAPLSIPFARLTLDNLARNISSPSFNLAIGYGTSFFLAAVTVLLVLVTGAACAYVLSRNRKGGYRYTYLLLLLGLMLPIQVILLPIVKILRVLQLMFSVWGLLILYIGWYMPFAVFTFVGYIGTISPQLDESAKIDGANEAQTFFRIIMPLMGPVLTSVAIYIAVWTWNDFVSPLIILGSGKFYTVTMGIYRAIGQYTQKWEDVFAILLFAIAPLIIFFIAMQRQFISGMTSGALKG